MKPDSRAIGILLKAYWSSAGWRPKPEFTPADKRYATAAGYLFPKRKLKHDTIVAEVIAARDAVTKRAVVDAFVASLGTRALEYRSALGSYAHVLHLREHPFERTPGLGTAHCATCGFQPKGPPDDPNCLNFERHKFGGVRHDDVAYEALDLQQFAQLRPLTPGEADRAMLRSIVDLARRGKTRYGDFKKALGSVVPSNDAERDGICHVLSYAGVLQPPDCPSYFRRYVPFAERGSGPHDDDRQYPLTFWTGGVVEEAVEFWFGPGV